MHFPLPQTKTLLFCLLLLSNVLPKVHTLACHLHLLACLFGLQQQAHDQLCPPQMQDAVNNHSTLGVEHSQRVEVRKETQQHDGEQQLVIIQLHVVGTR